MNRFKECREKANLLQKEVAIQLGIKSPSISDWEHGKTNPKPEHMVKLAKLYGVSIDYLLGANEASEPEEVEIEPIQESSLTDDEAEMLRRYRALDDDGKEIIRAEALREKRRATKAG